MCDGPDQLPNAVLVDFDSVLNNFDERMLQSINQRFGTTMRPMDLVSWDSLRASAKALTKEQEQYAWGPEVFGSAQWNASLRPTPGGISSLWRLYDLGVSLHVVTARPPEHGVFLGKWLQTYGVDGIVRWSTNNDKRTYALTNGITYAFDDSPRQIQELLTVCPVAVIDRPYNGDGSLFTSRPLVPLFGYRRYPSLYLAVEDLAARTGWGHADQISQSARSNSQDAVSAG